MDKVKIPLIGGLLRDLAGCFGLKSGFLPRFHLVAARLGSGASAVVAERWQYRGDWLHAVYDTRQVFKADYPHGVHSVLHPGYFQAAAGKPRGFFARLAQTLGAKDSTLTCASMAAPKPKLTWVDRVQRLPPDRRIPALKLLGVID